MNRSVYMLLNTFLHVERRSSPFIDVREAWITKLKDLSRKTERRSENNFLIIRMGVGSTIKNYFNYYYFDLI